jgi:hypothetical protein
MFPFSTKCIPGYFHKLINKAIGDFFLSPASIKIRAKGDGFGLCFLNGRYDICKIPNLGHLIGREIGEVMKKCISALAYDRRVPSLIVLNKCRNSSFSTGRLIPVRDVIQ